MNELEEAILKQMNEEEGTETEDESLQPAETENITEGEYQPQMDLKPLSKKGVGLILDQVVGTQFKMGEAMFEIKSVNKGKCRFTAEIINEVVQTSETIDYIGRARAKGKDKKDDSTENNPS